METDMDTRMKNVEDKAISCIESTQRILYSFEKAIIQKQALKRLTKENSELVDKNRELSENNAKLERENGELKAFMNRAELATIYKCGSGLRTINYCAGCRECKLGKNEVNVCKKCGEIERVFAMPVPEKRDRYAMPQPVPDNNEVGLRMVCQINVWIADNVTRLVDMRIGTDWKARIELCPICGDGSLRDMKHDSAPTLGANQAPTVSNTCPFNIRHQYAPICYMEILDTIHARAFNLLTKCKYSDSLLGKALLANSIFETLYMEPCKRLLQYRPKSDPERRFSIDIKDILSNDGQNAIRKKANDICASSDQRRELLYSSPDWDYFVTRMFPDKASYTLKGMVYHENGLAELLAKWCERDDSTVEKLVTVLCELGRDNMAEIIIENINAL